LLDLLKATGCLLIVLHHLAFYGPMSDVVSQAWPRLIHGLSEYGRLAVQLFLVCSGFLSAASLAAQPGMGPGSVLQLAWQRYLRLSIPLMAALSAAVLITEWVRPHFDHPSLSATPDGWQTVAHVFFLQHLADLEALSAGVWYVAIDFQLYLMTLLVLWVVTLWSRVQPGARPEALRLQLMLGLTLVSLLHWNLQPELDLYGLYFFGAYGMGWLAHRARQSRIPPKGWAVLMALGLLALWVDPRWRIATAWAVALLLATAPERWLAPVVVSGWRAGVSQLSRISYPVFLIHYAVSLAVSAFVTAHWPRSLVCNGLGMAAVVLLSLLAGLGLYRLTERPRPSLRRWLVWAAVFMASTGLAMRWAGSA
jgi:peptidoglycan/LPS O-acetylase OafA/YrhL